jgi:hypothetical protein
MTCEVLELSGGLSDPPFHSGSALSSFRSLHLKALNAFGMRDLYNLGGSHSFHRLVDDFSATWDAPGQQPLQRDRGSDQRQGRFGRETSGGLGWLSARRAAASSAAGGGSNGNGGQVAAAAAASAAVAASRHPAASTASAAASAASFSTFFIELHQHYTASFLSATGLRLCVLGLHGFQELTP